MKICIACSAGGHLTEALQLSEVWHGKEHFFITDKRINALDLKEKKYFIIPARRNYFKFLISFLQSLYIIILERPSVIISTGAEIGFPALLIGHYLGIKTIYIESLARVNSPSLCGKLVYGKVDHFYVQWKNGLKFFPKAKYVGSVFD
jgi:beta-1,4-N-acetylglucosaminyltransferase